MYESRTAKRILSSLIQLGRLHIFRRDCFNNESSQNLEKLSISQIKKLNEGQVVWRCKTFSGAIYKAEKVKLTFSSKVLTVRVVVFKKTVTWNIPKKTLKGSNRPFPSSSQPPFQSEAKCEVCYENQFSFILKLELIIITKISHLDSLWKRDWGELGNGLFSTIMTSFTWNFQIFSENQLCFHGWKSTWSIQID